jgi:putative membrane protein
MRPYVVICGLSACLGFAVPASAKSDKEFIRDALRGDNSEITLGLLAQKMGSNEQVRNFGTVLVSDHSAAKNKLGLLATKFQVESTDAISDQAKQELQKLRGLSGKAFDHEFARYMVEDHEKDIAEFKQKAHESKGEVSTLAAHTVAVLKKHLETAQQLFAQK